MICLCKYHSDNGADDCFADTIKELDAFEKEQMDKQNKHYFSLYYYI